MRVALLDDIHQAYAASPGVSRLRARGVEVQIFTRPIKSPEELLEFDALIANRERTRFSRELLSHLPNLRIIAQTGIHAYHIDFEAAHEHGIIVGKATGGPSIGASELSIGLMLALARHICDGDAAIKRGEWPSPLGQELSGQTLGLIGLGNVGRRVAKLANAFDMRVVAWTPSLTEERARASGAERRGLDQLLRESDIASVHVALSDASRGLIDAARLALMKPTALLINTSRGPIVEEAALIDALASRRIAGAALDVFDVEPLPPGHPFTKLPNVVLTPHLGWPTASVYDRFSDAAADVLLAYIDGRDIPHFDD